MFPSALLALSLFSSNSVLCGLLLMADVIAPNECLSFSPQKRRGRCDYRGKLPQKLFPLATALFDCPNELNNVVTQKCSNLVETDLSTPKDALLLDCVFHVGFFFLHCTKKQLMETS